MGLCVSVKRDADSAGKSRSVMSNVEKRSIPSPVKEKSGAVNAGNRAVDDVALLYPHSTDRFTAAGSKEEAFFDLQTWVESDVEDDYFSVKGDFTPSCASTPVHHFSEINMPLPTKGATGTAQASSPPPREQKAQSRLLDLFNNEKEAPTKVEGDAIPSLPHDLKSKSGRSSFSFSWRSSDGNAPTGKAQRLEVESPKSALRCLPRRSSSGRRKRTSWPRKQNSG